MISKHICLDGFNFALPQGTGVATYARNLANTLHTMGHRVSTLYGAPIDRKAPELVREVQFYDFLAGSRVKRPFHRVVAQHIKQSVEAPFGKKAWPIPYSGHVESRRFEYRLPTQADIFNSPNLFNTARMYFARHGRFLNVRFDEPPHIMHWTYPLPVRVPGIPNIYTLHDLVPLKLPYTTLDNKRYYHRLIKQCISEAARICTVSERSLADIVSMYPEAASKIINTYQAVAPQPALSNEADQHLGQEVHGLFSLQRDNYFLYFGAIEPKKNVGRLIEAYLSAQLDTPLVIVGAEAWKAQDELKLYHNLAAGNPEIYSRVRLMGYLPQPFLVKLIRAAKAVVFPSLYEGFGLPVLEAMQLGTPTLCSREGALAEIAGDASLVIDPYNIDAIAEGLRLMDGNDALRRQLIGAGKAQASKFSESIYQLAVNKLYTQL